MKNKLSPEDQTLFRLAMKQVKPLAPQRTKIKPEPVAVKTKPRPAPEEPPVEVLFSDAEYLDLVDSETRLEFARPGCSHKLLRDLRRGGAGFQATLDLHGKTVTGARLAVQRFITACCTTGCTRTLIIHGKGHAQAKPILKNKLNHWLRQSEAVVAFCSARKEDGGGGAIYLRLKAERGKKQGAKKTPPGRRSRGRLF